MKKRSGKLILPLVWLALALTSAITLKLLKNNVALSEKICVLVSGPLARAERKVSASLPFSLYEILLLGVIALAVILLVVFIKRLRAHAKKSALRLAIVVLACVFTFASYYTLSIGFAYTRERLAFPAYLPQKEEAVAIATRYFDELNATVSRLDFDEKGNAVCPYTKDELTSLISEEYARLTTQFPTFSQYLYEGDVPVKPMFLSRIMSELNLSGFYFAPTGEANVNVDAPSVYYFTSGAHEVAHGKGVVREDEANLISYILALNSQNDYVRYTGFMFTYQRMAEVLRYYDAVKYDEIIRNFPSAMIGEIINVNEFWGTRGTAEKISNAVNDLYLKASGYLKGVAGYTDTSTVKDVTAPGSTVKEYEITYSPVQLAIFELFREI